MSESPLSHPLFVAQLLAALSHELGSPLAVIKSTVTGLIDYRQRLSTTEDLIRPTRTWLTCRLDVPELAQRYFLQGFLRWHIEWVEVVEVEDIVLPSFS
ncbi:MAG TPA: hypothetical protein VFF59_09415 [Anaerolineae bacterium]|nr:hypothetical protein [Anaerolineae bacterium]